jgi:adenine C2-methylase RlmN of 23S rRNA A2503 and tRNA A37
MFDLVLKWMIWNLNWLKVVVNIRRIRGENIHAACGQLANKNKAISSDDLKMKG